jgi:flagellar motor switch protein FliN/FliY
MDNENQDELAPTEARKEGSRTAGLDNAFGRIPVLVQVVLGGTTMTIAEVIALEPGALIKLDRKIGDPVDILVNGSAFAKGELAIVEGETPRFAISITQLCEPSEQTTQK